MSLLIKEDWKKLRDVYGVAFTGMPDDLFDVFLSNVFGVASEERGEEVNEVDAMMFCLARSEPGIQPAPPQILKAGDE